jgi:hypothetical protein
MIGRLFDKIMETLIFERKGFLGQYSKARSGNHNNINVEVFSI